MKNVFLASVSKFSARYSDTETVFRLPEKLPGRIQSGVDAMGFGPAGMLGAKFTESHEAPLITKPVSIVECGFWLLMLWEWCVTG